jgi:sialidase-1
MIPTRFGLKLDVVSLLLLTIACLAPTCVAKQDQQPAPQLDSVAYVSGTEGYACYRCPTLAVSNAGTVLAFCEGRVHGHKDEDDMDVVLKRSTDGGRTWGPLQVLANDGKNPC